MKNSSPLIPRETELLGRKIKVMYDSPLIKSKEGYYGYTNVVNCDIHIATSIESIPIPQSEQEITYFHEIFHLLFSKLGYEDKIERAGIDIEKIVEDLAVGIHQILTKAKR
jgi:hypothetical protein